jgi:hypothetical protein
MPRTVDRNAEELMLTVRLATAADVPITGVAYNDGTLSVSYMTSASDDWQDITLVDGDVDAWSSAGWAEVGEGIYRLGLPNAAIVPGDRTMIRISRGSNPVRYDSIDAVVYDPASTAQAVANVMASVSLNLQQQITVSGQSDIVVYQGDDYTRSGWRVNLDTSELDDPDMDLSAYKLIIAADTNPRIALRLEIVGDPGEHYALLQPPSSITEAWPTGRFGLLYRIEWAENEYTTLNGRTNLQILPFDIDEADITDLPVT